MLHTRLCDLVGIEFPIICAPMGFIAGPELAVAVSNAGGLGIIPLAETHPLCYVKRFAAFKALPTTRLVLTCFYIILWMSISKFVLRNMCRFFSFLWGDPSPLIEQAHAVGVKFFHRVGSVKAAQRVAETGVDAIIAKGVEAGVHVKSDVTTMALLLHVVDAVSPILVVAAGGIADASGLVTALALGADGVVLGTRFLATTESNAHLIYKQRVLKASEENTVPTTLFWHGWPNAPYRTIRPAFVEERFVQEARGNELRPDEPVKGESHIGGQLLPVVRFKGFSPSKYASGDIESMNLVPGQYVGLINEIKPPATILRTCRRSPPDHKAAVK